MKKKQKLFIYLAAFILPAVIALIGLISGGFAPFGNKDVLTSGGMESYIPYFNELYDRVHNGTFLAFNETNGQGYDFTTIFTYYLSDPLNLIILLFPKASMLSVLNILYMLKLGLAGLLFSVFLCHRHERELKKCAENALLRKDEIDALEEKRLAKKAKREEKKKKAKKDIKLGGSENPSGKIGSFFVSPVLPIIAFSVCYALSGYMVSQGFDITHLSSVCLFPIIIMGIDKLIEESNWRLYTISVAISFFTSFYMAFLISIFTFVYFILQNYTSGKHFIKSFVLKLLSDILAVGLGSFIIINCLKSTIINDNLSIKFPYPEFVTSFFDVIKMQTTKVKSSIIYPAADGIDIYAGIIVLFLVFVYILNKNLALKERIKNAALILILFASTYIVTPNYIFNGLLMSEDNKTCFGFIFVFVMLTVSYSAFINITHSTSRQLVISAIIAALLVVSSLIMSNDYDTMSPFLLSLEFIFVYFIITIVWKNESMSFWLMKSIVSVIMIAEIAMSFSANIKEIGLNTYSYKATDTYKYEAARSYIQGFDPGAKVLTHEYNETSHTPVSDSLLGYKYVLILDGINDLPLEYTKVDSFMDVDIYENPYVTSGYFYVNDKIENWSYNESYPLTSTNLLFEEVLGFKKPFVISTGAFSYDKAYLISPSNPNKYLDNAYVFYFKPDLYGDFYGYVMHTIHFGNITPEDSIAQRHLFTKRERLTGSLDFEFGVFDLDAFENGMSALKTITPSKSGNLYTMSFAADEDGYIFVSKQYSNSWVIKNNGSTAKTISISDKYIGIPVTKGQNDIEFMYFPTFLYIGLVFTILAIVVFVLLSIKATAKARSLINNKLSSNKLSTLFANFAISNYVYIMTFIISFSVFVFCMMLKSCIPFGNDTAVTSDGFAQSMPLLYHLYSGIKSFSLSSFNTNVGILTNDFTVNLATLLNPICDIYLLFPTSLANLAFVVVFGIGFSVTGLPLIFYLTHRPNQKSFDKSNKILIALGISYSLCTFATSYFCFLGFSFVSMMFPFVVWSMENLIYNKKPLPYILILAYTMITLNYYCFLMCEILFLMFFIYEHKSFKNFVMNGIRFGLSSIVSALLSAFSLLPFYMSTRMSPYVGNDSTFPKLSLDNSILANLRSFMIGHVGNIVTEDSTSANIYCGLLILILSFVYLAVKDIPLSVRIRKTLLSCLLFFAYGNDLLNFILHGFHYQSMVPNRFAIFWVFLIITMAYDVIINFESINKKLLLTMISIPSAALLVIWSIPQDFPHTTTKYKLSAIFIIVYLCVSFIYILKNNRKKLIKVATFLLMSELLISSVYNTYNIMGGNVGFSLEEHNKIDKLMSRVDDSSSVITEYVNSGEYNLGNTTDTRSLSIFSSCYNKYQQEMLNEWGIPSSTNYVDYVGGNPLADMMLNVKYQITNTYYDSSFSIYPELASVDNINLHENPYYVAAGFMVDTSFKDYPLYKAVDSFNMIDYQNQFTNYLGFGDLYTYLTLETASDKINENYSYCYANTDSLGEDGTGNLQVKFYIAKDLEGELYIPASTYIMYLGPTKVGEHTCIEADYPVTENNKNYTLKVAILNKDVLEKVQKYFSESKFTNASFTDNQISGSVECSKDGILYLSYPNYPHKKVYVDGKQVEAVDLLGGIGIELTSGSHEIRIEFYTPLLTQGIIVSLIALAILVVIIIINKRKKKLNIEA